jgi:hypothetical protein
MRIRPTFVAALVALLAGLVAQTALGSPPVDLAPAPEVTLEPAAYVTPAADTAKAQRRARPAGFGVAALTAGVAASARPGGPAIGTIPATTEFGSQKVLSVVRSRGDWLGVIATGRPNGALTWIRRDAPGLRLSRTRWSLHADISARTLTLRHDGRAVRRLTVAVGRPGADTPTGRFAVTDKMSGSRYGAYYGCCILALSGTQPNLPAGWSGGNRIAIHGTDSPSTIGTAASAGCLRAGDADLQALMAKVPVGTPVFIGS